MKARVNGELRDLPDGATVAAVLDLLGAPVRGVAVAVDGEVVPRAAWPSTTVPDGGTVEVLTAVQGG
ncbi:sulfur carrier protein ThiS [Umezawaea endophytica]|uniref:Sulfur carrier protein ThiS n=1 Tax=Umezawaea endophytica TaxID=1654476 RepID=A0A9X2VLR6_9PSEU|nr:sulfur carrier protein ThiS [Umezawaea endophytica]MCS7478857.1 sulfur carrier protein ThiS [Umezawaea endophytica]